jgi:hypothetical protein
MSANLSECTAANQGDIEALEPPQVSPPRRGHGFSRLNRQSGSEIFTKFDNVKSRIAWTPERRHRLQEMWDGGDKAPTIAAALGCKVGAVNVARARFGLKPRASYPDARKNRMNRRTKSSGWRSPLRG